MKKILLLLLLLASVNMTQAREVTPPPVVNVEITDEAVIITATGNGEVHLYVNDEEVENPYTIARGDEDFTIFVYATAQEEGKDKGTSEIRPIVIEAVEGGQEPYPYEDHEKGYWVVLRDRFGHDVWHEMSYYETTAKLYYSVYGGYNPDTDEQAFIPTYIVINGIRYGAPSANTEVVLGNALENPLIESDNFYLISAGYKVIIGVAQSMTSEELYLYVIRLGYPLIQDEVSGEWIPEDPTQFITGDVDGNAKVTIADVTIMIDYLLNGYSTGMNMDNADVDGSGKINIEDVTLLIDYLLKGSWW